MVVFRMLMWFPLYGPGTAFPKEELGGTCCPGCSCDLSTIHGIDEFMQSLGYDRCIDDGSCEPCTEEELLTPPCSSGQRQKVICTRCQGMRSHLPFCGSGYRIFWSSNHSSANVSGPSAGLFHRSCGQEGFLKPPSGSRNGVFTGDSPLDAEGTPETAKSEKSGGTSNSRHIFRFGGDGDEGSTEVLYFLFANALVLAASAWSLRRQQQKQWEKTMEGLYSCIEEGIPSASAGSSSKLEPPWRDPKGREIRSPSPEPSGPDPLSIGKSIESLADAVAKTTNAMMGEGCAQKTK
mmetsp:Transcript_13715/g.30318  ORF Transcript_13715/g.30318 Transcript_13715/m.30318 type:complete len:293 (+) Transcript_13715:96-974(+)